MQASQAILTPSIIIVNANGKPLDEIVERGEIESQNVTIIFWFSRNGHNRTTFLKSTSSSPVKTEKDGERYDTV